MPPPPGPKALVADGEQALVAAAAGDVSVVLLDVEMPVLDGFVTSGAALPVKVSIAGAALAGGDGDVGSELALRIADTNRYASKDAGRDRCQITPVGGQGR